MALRLVNGCGKRFESFPVAAGNELLGDGGLRFGGAWDKIVGAHGTVLL